MKKKRIKDLIQGPLRFHHQDIHEELDNLKQILNELIFRIIELQKEVLELKAEKVKNKGCSKCGTDTVTFDPNSGAC